MLYLSVFVLALTVLNVNAQFGMGFNQNLGVRGPVNANYNGYSNTGLYGQGGYGGGQGYYGNQGGGSNGYYGNQGGGSNGYYGNQGGYRGNSGYGGQTSVGIPALGTNVGTGTNLGLGLGR